MPDGPVTPVRRSSVPPPVRQVTFIVVDGETWSPTVKATVAAPVGACSVGLTPTHMMLSVPAAPPTSRSTSGNVRTVSSAENTPVWTAVPLSPAETVSW